MSASPRDWWRVEGFPQQTLFASGELTWGFQLDEPNRRGQYNGTMAAAQVATEASWWRLANAGPGDRFREPTVVGVDFPAVALREARWDADRAMLTVAPVGIEVSSRDRTSFRVTNIGDPGRWTVDGPGATEAELRAVGADLEVEMPVRGGEPVLLCGPDARS